MSEWRKDVTLSNLITSDMKEQEVSSSLPGLFGRSVHCVVEGTSCHHRGSGLLYCTARRDQAARPPARTSKSQIVVVAALRKRYKILSPREQEVMGLVVSGMLNEQIASELGISEVTVKIHRGQGRPVWIASRHLSIAWEGHLDEPRRWYPTFLKSSNGVYDEYAPAEGREKTVKTLRTTTTVSSHLSRLEIIGASSPSGWHTSVPCLDFSCI